MYIAQIMADIIDEELSKDGGKRIDSILGITINGIPFATMASYLMEKELIVYRPHHSRQEGFFSSNFASVKGKNVVIIDDVASTGETLRRTITDIKNEGGIVLLVIVLASKLHSDEISGVRIRSIIRTNIIGNS